MTGRNRRITARSGDRIPARSGDRITDVVGITVGHHQRLEPAPDTADRSADVGTAWATGTTVIGIGDVGGSSVVSPELSLSPVVSVDVRGGGPGTRETDLLAPSNTVQTAHAIVLGGGSAYGLAAADGVMSALEERGVGLPMDEDGHVVPIVPAAVVFDLPMGDWKARPDATFGTRALAAAASEFEVGSVGAGTGARAGALKGGVGTASIRIDDGPAAGICVGALIVANPVGAVIDPATGLPWDARTESLRRHGLTTPRPEEIASLAALAEKSTVLNTTIGVVATDAALSKADTHRIAMAAHDGLARAVVPAHSPLDGDTIFAVATGAAQPVVHAQRPAVPPGMNPDAALVTELSRVAADAVARAIVDAVVSATSVAGVPAYREVVPSAFADR